MNRFEQFIIEHENDDVTRLLLSKNKWPDIDISLAAATITCRSRIKDKVPQWYAVTSLIYPDRLCSEQCSSSWAAEYKAALAKKIIGHDNGRIADLTGGLGIDSWAFSQIASKVLYNEGKEYLAKAAKHNFKELSVNNIDISNETIDTDNVKRITDDFRPDLVFMDPARRSSEGKKVFLIEDCSPDILKLKDIILRGCRNILVKLSPMADISMVAERLGKQVREIHITGTSGECKELLVWMDSQWNVEYRLVVNDSGNILEIESSADDSAANPAYINNADSLIGKLLIEPGKTLMKAGRFNYLSSRFKMHKLGKNTHLYISEALPQALEGLCKCFRIIDICPLSSRNIKETGQKYRHASVTAKNIPMKSDELRIRMKTIEDGMTHIFAAHLDDSGNYLIITEKLINNSRK